MRAIDASAVLDLWEMYPASQFPLVWDWLAEEIEARELSIAEVALEEVGHKEPACHRLLKQYGIAELKAGNAEIAEAMKIKAALGIVNEEYSTGVDENDIFIIACAKVRGVELITCEALQPNLPTNMSRYKIPAVCSMACVQVKTLRLIEFIRQSGKVFR